MGFPVYTPQPSDRFTFGLWTTGNRGRDPFGSEVRPVLSPVDNVELLASIGAYGVNFHDNDLLPIDATPAEREQILRDFEAALSRTGLKVPMVTVNLFSEPVFRDGAFTSHSKQVRQYAVHKAMASMDVGARLGAEVFVLWGGREGSEVDAGKDPRDALKWYREGVDFLCEYALDRGYKMRLALEAKPNEPRGDIFLPTTGAMLGFIATLQHPEMVGVNPEFAHEVMAGLNFVHQVAQALDAGKLFHIDLNDQKGPRFDQDLRFGAENIKSAFFLVKLLEDAGYTGMRHFDAHALRTEDASGVRAFAEGCMRTYLILKEKAQRFHKDAEIAGILSELSAMNEQGALVYSTAEAQRVASLAFDRHAHAAVGLGYEKLDQLVMELLLGVR
ncbi:MAG: xylose isomerase [Firmicutes bacterium]|nr:xylose isomerase [Bacillota bacterium]